ncbi:hypothetical protein MLD52_03960 [Puniceicoccaceae bacterium K14]|nr:hypothetical protein [Puniceicoccaceae bacterium K14]
MALDIGIEAIGENGDPLERDLTSSLKYAHYSFLMKYLETFTNATGVNIEPYDDARVCGKQLDLLKSCLSQALSDISKKPDEWDEYVGYEIKPRKNIYERIRRREFLHEIRKTLELISRARSDGRTLFFFGD